MTLTYWQPAQFVTLLRFLLKFLSRHLWIPETLFQEKNTSRQLLLIPLLCRNNLIYESLSYGSVSHVLWTAAGLRCTCLRELPSVTDSSKVISSRVLSPVHMCAALSVNLLLCGMSSSLWLIGGSLLRMFIWCWGHGGLRIQWLGTVATRWLSRCYWRIMMFSSVIYV